MGFKTGGRVAIILITRHENGGRQVLLQDHVTKIRAVLQRERSWRERVFSGARRAAKVGEIDDALDSLVALEAALRALAPDQFPEQQSLFSFEENHHGQEKDR